MRPLRRPEVSVPTLALTGVGGRRRADDIDNYEQTGTLPTNFPQHWTKPDVRGALCAMQGHVCAYCGADIAEVGIDVEHFRPKGSVRDDANHGGYWWLAYDFSNYVLSCTVCNQRYKGNRFPLQDGTDRVRYDARDRLTDERPILLDPTLDPVEDLLSFDWRKPAGRLVPKPGIEATLASRVERVLEFFRVNLRAAQRKKRAEIQKLVVEKVAENKAEEVRALAIRYRPHSVVARKILEDKAPQALPTPEEELQWLLEQLSSELIFKLEDLSEPSTASQLDENDAKELLWALAVLWKDPPVGTSESVEQFLDSRGLRDTVAEYFRLL